jgi:hypothetical protein
MAKSSQGWSQTEFEQSKAVQLEAAYEQLESTLETVDLEDKPDLAEVVIDAVEATNEAYTLETGKEARCLEE